MLKLSLSSLTCTLAMALVKKSLIITELQIPIFFLIHGGFSIIKGCNFTHNSFSDHFLLFFDIESNHQGKQRAVGFNAGLLWLSESVNYLYVKRGVLLLLCRKETNRPIYSVTRDLSRHR